MSWHPLYMSVRCWLNARHFRALGPWAPAGMDKMDSCPPLEIGLGGLDFFILLLRYFSLFTITVSVCKLFIIPYISKSLKLIYEHSRDPQKHFRLWRAFSDKFPSFPPAAGVQQTKNVRSNVLCLIYVFNYSLYL